MSVGAVAERYAQALFELGEESGQLSAIAAGLSAFAQAFESSKELRLALSNPVFKKEERRALVAAVAAKFNVPDVAVKALKLMADRQRLLALPAASQRLTEMADKKAGVLRASVTTAAAMPEAYYQALTSKLSAATNKKIVLSRIVDAELVGGVVTRIGDNLVDGSIRGKLQKMERQLVAAVLAGMS